MPDIEYQPSAAARRVHVERDGDVTRVVVAMVGPYVPLPEWVGSLDLFSLVVAPIAWAIVWSARTMRRLPTPPRATFEIDALQVRVEIRDQGTGEVTRHAWPRAAIVELRANRFDAGLWAYVTGHGMHTLLDDVPRDAIERLAASLADALRDRSAG